MDKKVGQGLTVLAAGDRSVVRILFRLLLSLARLFPKKKSRYCHSPGVVGGGGVVGGVVVGGVVRKL